jgi:hypothetical protein
MKQFFKENLVIVCGILLPLMLALVFFAASRINMVYVDPPRTSVVYAANYPDYYNNNNLWQLSVRDGVVYVRYTAPPKPDPANPAVMTYYNNNPPDIHLFDPVSGRDRQIALPDFAADESGEKAVIDLGNIRLDTASQSPDGYVFENDAYRDYNIMTEIFGGGNNYRNTYVLRKNGNRVPVASAPSYNSKFLGWVVP